MFVDQVTIFVQSGHGGKGCVSFRRERFIPKGGPDGGDGGRGGDVVLVATQGPTTLAEFRYRKRYIAKNGGDGSGKQCSGKASDNLEVKVPVGTSIWNDETGELLADLVEDGQRFVAATGGKGGLGNQHFASSTRQAPRYAQPGLPGEELWLRMELKLLADVGLVGLPNAGKSTLISRMSAARPKVADYPFTTLVPNLGVVTWGDYHSFVMADIPGLIEGAHDGKGLGHTFLRHVERTRYLLFMVDVTGMTEMAPAQTLDVLSRELAAYDANLAKRPFAVVATKMDAADPEALADAEDWAKQRGLPLWRISAVTGDGIDALTHHLGEQVERLKLEAPAGPIGIRVPADADGAREAGTADDVWQDD
ncbi:MAG: GTPase ObgE [Leptospirillia bacterium]